jgi:hypothetical protein
VFDERGSARRVWVTSDHRTVYVVTPELGGFRRSLSSSLTAKLGFGVSPHIAKEVRGGWCVGCTTRWCSVGPGHLALCYCSCGYTAK